MLTIFAWMTGIIGGAAALVLILMVALAPALLLFLFLSWVASFIPALAPHIKSLPFRAGIALLSLLITAPWFFGVFYFITHLVI